MVNLPLESFAAALLEILDQGYNLYGDMLHIADIFYHFVSRKTSQKALERVLPDEHKAIFYGNYNFVIEAYADSGIVPQCPLSRPIADALADPHIQKDFEPFNLSILQAFGKESDLFIPFFEYICHCHFTSSYFRPKNELVFWSWLIDIYFKDFARNYKIKAKRIGHHLIAMHPLLAYSNKCKFDMYGFLDRRHTTLADFFEPVARRMFHDRWALIFTQLNNLPNQQSEFFSLLGNYKKTVSYSCQESKYACAFLQRIDFEYVNICFKMLSRENFRFYDRMSEFSAFVYENTNSNAAKSALKSVLPLVYEVTLDKSYASIMSAYAQSKLEPRKIQFLNPYAQETRCYTRLGYYPGSVVGEQIEPARFLSK